MSKETGGGADVDIKLPDDDHELWNWETKYAKEAWKHIWRELIYLGILFVIALVALVLHMTGVLYFVHITMVVAPAEAIAFNIFHRSGYCIIMGFLGGTIYDIKILYKSVARGKWHKDRLIWRIATPWVSLVLTIVVAGMMAEEIFSSASVFMSIVIGFFAGYFSESAIGKLYSIAQVLFG